MRGLAQVKLFVELFTSKYQGLFFKLLRATGDEIGPLKEELAHNLEVPPAGTPHACNPCCHS